MKVVRLVFGILSMAFSLVIFFQSCSFGCLAAVTDSNDLGGVAGVMAATVLLIVGIIMTCTWNRGVLGGAIAGLILSLIAVLFAFINDTMYRDLNIWGIFAVLDVIVNILSIIFRRSMQARNNPEPTPVVINNYVSEAPMEGKSFCPYCGTPIAKGEVFCHNCGKKL